MWGNRGGTPPGPGATSPGRENNRSVTQEAKGTAAKEKRQENLTTERCLLPAREAGNNLTGRRYRFIDNKGRQVRQGEGKPGRIRHAPVLCEIHHEYRKGISAPHAPCSWIRC